MSALWSNAFTNNPPLRVLLRWRYVITSDGIYLVSNMNDARFLHYQVNTQGRSKNSTENIPISERHFYNIITGKMPEELIGRTSLICTVSPPVVLVLNRLIYFNFIAYHDSFLQKLAVHIHAMFISGRFASSFNAACWRWWLVFYGHFCARGRLNGPSDLQMKWGEVKDETTFRYAHAEIRTRVVVICGPTRYR